MLACLRENRRRWIENGLNGRRLRGGDSVVIKGFLHALSPGRLTEQTKIRLDEVYAASKWRQLGTFFKVGSLIFLWTLLNVALGGVLFNVWPTIFVLFIPVITLSLIHI